MTRCLLRLRDGDQAAAHELLELVYAELRRSAAAAMRGERASHTRVFRKLSGLIWGRPPLAG